MSLSPAAIDAAHNPAVRKAVIDIATTAGVTGTLAGWLDVITVGYHGAMGIGAGLLLVGRLYLMWREIKAKRPVTEGAE